MAYSRAFKKFEERLTEVDHLRSLSRTPVSKILRNPIDQADHTNFLIRSATVLLCSHIQGFVEDLSDVLVTSAISSKKLGEILPDSFRYYILKGEFATFRQTDDPEKLVKAMRRVVQKRLHILDLANELPESLNDEPFKDGFGNPTSKEISKYLRRFGIEDFNEEIKTYLGNSTYTATNAVDQIVDRRTKIAHGNPLATLTPSEFSDYFVLVRKFCAAVDRLACSHFRKKGCSGFGLIK